VSLALYLRCLPAAVDELDERELATIVELLAAP
jgi:hypothetical protein